MQIATQGFVLREIPYGETSSIVKIYTQNKGLSSFILKGLRASKAAKGKLALLPLLKIDFSYIDFREHQNLSHIKSYRAVGVQHKLYSNYAKLSMLSFFAEILSKSCAEHQADNLIFSYIDNFLEKFAQEEKFSHYHILFLLEMTRLLGCYPSRDELENHFFFSISIEEEAKQLFLEVLRSQDGEKKLMELSYTERKMLLEILVKYYCHQFSISELRTYTILKEVFG